MRAIIVAVVLGAFVLGSGAATARSDKDAPASKVSAPAKTKRLPDALIKRLMIQESIDAYSGNCPCPYNTASNGSSCGRRSAWSRAGGAEPLCYASDISAEMVAEYRTNHSDD